MPLSVASPPTPLPAMTFRLAAVVPPMVLPSDPVRMKMTASALRTAAAAVPRMVVPGTSDWLDLIETPPTAHWPLPLQVHDMLTEAAPAAVLPPPLISGALR